MMAQYSRMDPYLRSRFDDHGIDAKIVIMGNTGVGKSSLLHRYTQNKFDPKNTTSTTGAFFVTKKVYVDGLKVRLQLWDTAGQERFRSMAPMYYRGANAALLLYDITNASTFDDIRGWLEELKRNCSSDLIIYIVGSKSDLHHLRQVTSDRARLLLHNWFPPPRPPTPPPPPPPPSTLSYIRPRFTSFTGIRSPASPPPPPKSSDTPPSLDAPFANSTGLKRGNTSTAVPRSRTKSLPLARSNSLAGASERSPLPQSRFVSNLGLKACAWNDSGDTSSNSINEDDEDDNGQDDYVWGLHKGMELFEVSAKDDFGIQQLFDSLISVIIMRRDLIEKENELKRDSIFLSSTCTPTWTAQAEEEEAREKAARMANSWTCCST